MIIKKIFSCFVLIILAFGCNRPFDYVELAGQIRSQTGRQLEKEKGLRPVGTMGQMMDDVQAIGLFFQYFQLVDLAEARSLIVYATQTFLKNINDNKEIRPYLHNYPFTAKNLEITISVSQKDGYPPPQGNIQVVSMDNGVISYELTAPSKFEPWPVLHKETYEEALKIVEENS